MKNIPFEVVRNDRKALVDQVVDGFRTAIASGYYKAGDVLPSRQELAEILNVSVRVPRDAMERLAREGLVNPRRGLGSIVLSKGNVLWRGHVLFVWLVEDETSYFATKLIGEVRRRLIKAGYMLSSVALPSTLQGRVEDLSSLDMAFCQSADLVIALAIPQSVRRYLSRKGARFVCVGEAGCCLPGCVGNAYIDSLTASRQLVADCVRQNVRKVLEVSWGRQFLCENVVKGVDVSVEHCAIRPTSNDGVLDSVMQSAFDFVLHRFSGSVELPDAIFFSDDYVAFGAITALATLGIRAPEDIGLIVLANKGFAPVYDRSLAKIEYDFSEYGVGIAEYALKILSGGIVPRRISFGPRYVPGETFSLGSSRRGLLDR